MVVLQVGETPAFVLECRSTTRGMKDQIRVFETHTPHSPSNLWYKSFSPSTRYLFSEGMRPSQPPLPILMFRCTFSPWVELVCEGEKEVGGRRSPFIVDRRVIRHHHQCNLDDLSLLKLELGILGTWCLSICFLSSFKTPIEVPTGNDPLPFPAAFSGCCKRVMA